MTITYPPGPPGYGIVESLRTLMRGNLSGMPTFLSNVALTYGPMSHWRVGSYHFYLVDDPALIEELLVTRARDYIKGRSMQRLKKLVGNGVLSSEPPIHLQRRRTMQPAFHRERLAAYAAAAVASTESRAEDWTNGQIIAMEHEMSRLTLEITAAALFSVNVRDEGNEICDSLSDAMSTFAVGMGPLGSLLDLLPMLPVTRRFANARKRLDTIVYRLISKRRESNDETDDLFSMLLAARDDDGQPMTDEELRDEVMTILLAGHETTAVAVTWSCYILAKHPDVEAKILAELSAVLDGRPATLSDLPNLSYARAVVAESMRLFPPVWLLSRRAIRRTRLGQWEIPEGALVIASQIVTHSNPRLWREPERFRPERWSAEATDLPKFAYFPFGGGNRLCIGESFAWMATVLILATLLRHRHFECVDATPILTNPLITLRPKSTIRLRTLKRAPLMSP